MRSGFADLPLHDGRVPAWLSSRMAALGRVITEAIVLEYGRDELLARLAHPFWFQSFGAVMGMDWHSSGITTSVLGALKRGLEPVQDELGVYICGGRGRHSRKTPDELTSLGVRLGIDGDGLAHTSRLVAKVDSAAVQDGFQLYLHSFIITADGKWAVVQQGMNTERKEARRYHWLSQDTHNYFSDPHSAIDGPNQGTIVNLADRRAEAARACQLELVARGPDHVLDTLHKEVLPHLQLPHHHEVRAEDIVPRRLHARLAAAADAGPRDFAELLLVRGIGARALQALALVAEVVHGNASRFTDPARFSMAHGGKDGHPFPVPTKVYDHTIMVLRAAIESARLENGDRMAALQRIDEQALRLEATVGDLDVVAHLAAERAASPRYGGQTVFGFARTGSTRPGRARRSSNPPPPTTQGGAKQLLLPLAAVARPG